MGRWSSISRSPQLESSSAGSCPIVQTFSHTTLMWVGMVGVILVGAALRLIALDQVPAGLSHDEAYIGVTALEVWLLGRREIFFDIYNGIEPLIVYWQALYLSLFGITPVAMRLVNVTAGLLTIPLTYTFTRRLIAHVRPRSARSVAFLAALGVSLSFWAVFVSRLALRAVTLPLLELLAFYFLWLGLVADEADGLPACTRRLTYLALGGAWLGVAMYTYLSSRFLPFVPLLFFAYLVLRRQVRREHWLGMALFFAAWALVFAPLAVYYLNHPDVFGRRAGQVLNLPVALAGDPRPFFTATLRVLGMFVVLGADTSRYGLAGRPLFDPLGVVLFCTGLIVSLARLRRPAWESAPYAFLLIWWLVMLVPDFITGESPHFLRTIGALPPTYIFWALGIMTVWVWLTPRLPAAARRLALLALAVFLAAVAWFTVRDYFVRWATDAEARAVYGSDFTEIARYLETTDLEGPVVLSAPYYRDWDRFRLDLQTHHNPPFVVWFDGPRTFLLPPPESSLDPLYVFPRSAPPHPRWLSFLQLETRGSEMSVYRLKPEAQNELAISLDAIVSEAPSNSTTGSAAGLVQFLGYQLEGEARAGERLSLLLHWQPLRDVPGNPDYAFFAHLRDRRGYTWAQADANGYAVVDWQPGVQVLQWLELPLPPDLPSQDYALVVGLEDRGIGQPIVTSSELRIITTSVADPPPSPAEFTVPNPGEVTEGGLFTLRGHSLSPRFLKPGDSTHVALFWQARDAPDADYTLVLWLIDQSGGQITLEERQPLDGDYPTGRWGTGQWVRDRFDLTLPPDVPKGLYQVFAGWRDSSGVWLRADGEPGFSLGEIFIADQ